MKLKDLVKRIIFILYIGVPLGFSVISTVHVVDMFTLGNPTVLAYVSAIFIEFGAIATFLGLSVMKKLNKYMVWSLFILLFILQMVGNVYSSYSWATDKVLADPHWLAKWQDMINFIVDIKNVRDVKMVLALIVGVPSPVFSLFLLKSTMDYLEEEVERADIPVLTEAATSEEASPEVLVEPSSKELTPETFTKSDEQVLSGEIDNPTEEGRKRRLHPSRQT